MTEHQHEQNEQQRSATRRRAAESDGPSMDGGPAANSVLRLQSQVGNASVARLLQRAAEPEPDKEEEGGPLQASAEVGLEGGPLGSDLSSRIQDKRGGGTPLDPQTRTQMESGFGTKFDDVRVHSDSDSDALNRSISAKAFTTGSDVFFRQGVYQPGSSEGHSVLSHELTHVVQQRSMTAAGPMKVNPAGDSYEQQADAMASQVTSAKAAAPAAGGAAAAQRAAEPPTEEEPEAMAQALHEGVAQRAAEPPTEEEPEAMAQALHEGVAQRAESEEQPG